MSGFWTSWIFVFLLLSGGVAFMIHNTQHSLCLEDSPGEVLLKRCDLDSESQRWTWTVQGALMCVGSSRCLSARQTEPVRTESCPGPEVDPAGLVWDCDRDRLVSRNTSTLLSVRGRRLVLTQHGKHAKWRSLDEGDVCHEKLRLRRASEDSAHLDPAVDQTEDLAAMTEEQRENLRWFYRTEDPTIWKFVLLGLAFVCLLIGFLLLGMGAVANKSRKKIAMYKAAASLARKQEDEELRVISLVSDNGTSAPPSGRMLQDTSNKDMSELKAGDIVVTWKDGNTSCLYSEPEEEKEEEEEEKQEEVKQEEVKQEEVKQEEEKQEDVKQEEEKQEEEKQEEVKQEEVKQEEEKQEEVKQEEVKQEEEK